MMNQNENHSYAYTYTLPTSAKKILRFLDETLVIRSSHPIYVW